ncbi:pilus assembly PilX family protein [Glaciimonas sp. GG7]
MTGLRVTSSLTKRSGFALVTALLILVMLTLLAISMFRGYGLLEKIAGNVREKERAYESAQNALQYGEWWLGQGTPGIGVTCSTTGTVTSVANMQACSNLLTNQTDPANWVGSLLYTPPAMIVAAGGGTATDGNANLDINYAATPRLYVAYIGLAPSGQQALYTVTAAGFGGSTNSVSVVQSVVAVAAKVTPLDNP